MAKKRAIIFGSLVMLVGIGTGTWMSIQPKKKPPETVSVIRRTIQDKVVAIGHIVPKRVITVRSALDGLVVTLFHDIGDHIKKGDPLVQVGPNPRPEILAQALSQVREDQAQLHKAEKKLKADEYLIEKGLVTKKYGVYLSDKADFETAKATLRYHQQSLSLIQAGRAWIDGKHEKGLVVSPIKGQVLQRNVDIGDSIISLSSAQIATTLFTIADMNEMIFQGAIDEADAHKVTVGMPVTVEVGALPQIKIKGKLDRFALQSDEQSELYGARQGSTQDDTFNVGYRVEVGHLSIPKGALLRSGYSATATVVASVATQVLSIPENVLNYEGDQAYVWVWDGHESSRKNVTLGISDRRYIQVLNGLHEHNQVLVSAPVKAHSGDK